MKKHPWRQVSRVLLGNSGALSEKQLKRNPELDMDFSVSPNLDPFDDSGDDHVAGLDAGLVAAVGPGKHLVDLGLRLLLAHASFLHFL